MKGLKIFSGIVSTLIAVVLCWGLLYLCIGGVRDWTDDKIFGKGQQEEIVEDTTTPEEETEIEIENVARVNFTTQTITIGG